MSIPFEKEIDFATEFLVEKRIQAETDHQLILEILDFSLNYLKATNKNQDKTIQKLSDKANKRYLQKLVSAHIPARNEANEINRLIENSPIKGGNTAKLDTYKQYYLWWLTAKALKDEFGIPIYLKGDSASTKPKSQLIIAKALIDILEEPVNDETIASGIQVVNNFKGES